jgi:hypothetical protein
MRSKADSFSGCRLIGDADRKGDPARPHELVNGETRNAVDGIAPPISKVAAMNL